MARLRGNAFMQRGEVALALRMIPSSIPTFEELGLPPVATWLAELPRGLVLVTGPTGCGKSTTLASIIDHINEHRELHILTVEDPIEYVHQHKRSVVNQREVGLDSQTFERALRSALREDPDVLLIGEMRDLESIQIALTMAETGHLVFATLHTNDAAQALDRIIDVFPADRQDQIRVQLAASLAAVLAQRLVPRIGGGMVAAFEVLVATPAVRNLLREGKTNQLRNVMTTSQKDGMLTLEASMARLVQAGLISYEAALSRHHAPEGPGPSAGPGLRDRQLIAMSMHRPPPPRAHAPLRSGRRRGALQPGWLVAGAKLLGVTIAPETPRLLATFVDVLDDRPAFSVVALYAPIGLLDDTGPAGAPATAKPGPCSGPTGAQPSARPRPGPRRRQRQRLPSRLAGPPTRRWPGRWRGRWPPTGNAASSRSTPSCPSSSSTMTGPCATGSAPSRAERTAGPARDQDPRCRPHPRRPGPGARRPICSTPPPACGRPGASSAGP